MLHFDTDYMAGAHPKVMERLLKTNHLQTVGYGSDDYTKHAAKLIKDESSVMVGGFLSCGAPTKILTALAQENIKNLTVICNDTSVPNKDKSLLIQKDGLVKKVITK